MKAERKINILYILFKKKNQPLSFTLFLPLLTTKAIVFSITIRSARFLDFYSVNRTGKKGWPENIW